MENPFFQTYDPDAVPVTDDSAANHVERGRADKQVADCNVLQTGLTALNGVPADDVAIYRALSNAGLTFEQIQHRLFSILRAKGGPYAELIGSIRQLDLH
jgi:hypothetical protein